MTSATTAFHCIAVAAALAAGACRNPSATIVGAGEAPIPDIADPRAQELGRQGEAVTLDGAPVARMPARETTSLDRSGWQAVTVDQPRGQVEVQPTYYKRFDGSPDDPRARGDYPTIATALRTGGGRPTAVQDGFASPASGILWLVAVPGQIIVLPPWTIERQPTNDGVQWLPPAAAPVPAAP
ncbi:MAG: hypothetical protein FGM39_10850 [Phycisphaerales bacterium]|nr:hypothetical protein [Phycisphaerales bacterium]